MDYFSQPNATPNPDGAAETPMTPFPTAPLEAAISRQQTTNRQGNTNIPQPAIRLRRLPSSSRAAVRDGTGENSDRRDGRTARQRSVSEPQQPLAARRTRQEVRREPTTADLQTVVEEHSDATSPHLLAPPQARTGRIRAASNAARSMVSGRSRASSSASRKPLDDIRGNYESDIVDILDVIDPEVSTLNTLNNIQNTLFVPYLGRFLDRRPTYDLSRRSTGLPVEEEPEKITKVRSKLPATSEVPETQEHQDEESEEKPIALQELTHSHTLSSVMSGMSASHNFAVLPHGTLLEGWSDEDKAELNDHVRHLMHSRRAKFKRTMRAFGKFVRKPMGFLVTLWAFLLTFWGAAWVIFLIGWIYVGNRQAYFVEICDQILTALFCVVGIGLAPFRAVDTYHMIYIVHYHFLTWRLRREQALPELTDPNDLPEPREGTDLELGRGKSLENPVLTPEQQAKLIHHQTKFSKSHTFYKPHETFTHHAFSIYLLMTIVILFDCHSCLQMALGGTTWGIYYKVRPKALTAVILSCSITCNLSAGFIITVGDKRSRKKEVVEQILRQSLTEEAMHKLEKEKGLVAKKKPDLEDSKPSDEEAVASEDGPDVKGDIVTADK